MSKHHFHTLLSRYRQGKCTDQEKSLVEQWLSLIDTEKPNLSQVDNRQIENRIWSAIQQKQRTTDNVRKLYFYPSWRWVAAALVILGVAWGSYRWIGELPLDNNKMVSHLSNGLLMRANNTSESMAFRLEDGTEIHLSPQSSLEYPTQFDGNKREVFLKGKAFFKVARNPQKPFLVYTGDVVTKVLGTSFWINTGENNQAVEVSVLSGKVSVFQRDARSDYVSEKVKSGVILTPNQKVKYTEGSQAFETSLVEKPVLIANNEGQTPKEVPFVFDDAPLSDVVGQLEKAYGIEIILENEQLKSCLFTADITKQPLFTKLDLLCASLNAGYEVRGTKILVSGNGCSNN